MLSELDIAANVRRLGAPTAVVAGGADRLTPPALARELADALPDCTDLHELPRRGHMTPIETPAVIGTVLRELVRDHLTDAGAAAGTSAEPPKSKPKSQSKPKPEPKPEPGPEPMTQPGPKSRTKQKEETP